MSAVDRLKQKAKPLSAVERLKQRAQPAPVAVDEPEPGPVTQAAQSEADRAAVEARAEELRNASLLEHPEQAARYPLQLLMPGLDLPEVQAGLESMIKGDTLSKKSAGAIGVGEGVVTPLLLGAGVLGGGAITTAAKLGGPAAAAKLGGLLAGEGLFGYGAQQAAQYGLEQAGADPNTASVVSNVATLPLTAAGMARTGRGVLSKLRGAGGTAGKTAASSVGASLPGELPPLQTLEGGRVPYQPQPAEPVPGVKITLAASEPERTVRAMAPEPAARAGRVAAIDKEIVDIGQELTARGAQNPDVAAAYQSRLDQLQAERTAALAEPAPPETVPMTRERARAVARDLEQQLADPNLDDATRAQLEQQHKQLRDYGGQGIEDQPPTPAVDEGAQPPPRVLSDVDQERLANLEREVMALRQREMNPETPLFPEEQAKLGKSLQELQALRRETELPPPPGPAQTEAQLFPEPIGEPATGMLPPDMSYPQRRALEGRLKSAGSRAAAMEARGGDPAKLRALEQRLEAQKALEAVPQQAYQDRIQSPEQAPLPQEGVDIAVRPEESRYVPATPEEAMILDERRRAAGAPAETPGQSSVRPVTEQPIETVAPGNQGVLLPSAHTLEINAPDLARRESRYGKLKAESDKALAAARGYRDRLANRDLTPEQRLVLEDKLAKAEAKIGREEPLKESADAIGALRSRPGGKTFVAYLTGDANKAEKGLPVPEAGHIGAGNLPGTKFIGEAAPGVDRPTIKNATPLQSRQIDQRLQSVELQLQEADNMGLPRPALEDEATRLRAESTRLHRREIKATTERTLIERYGDDIEPPTTPPGSPPPDVPPTSPTPKGQGPGPTPPPAVKRGVARTLADVVRSLTYDSDWNFRNLGKTLKRPLTDETTAKTSPTLAKIADRFKLFRASGITRAARDFSRAWIIDPHRNLGLRYLSDDESESLFNTLDSDAAPLNDHVRLVADRMREIFGDIGSHFESMGGQTYDKRLKAWRQFTMQMNYAPHMTPSVRLLQSDKGVRARVAKYMLNKFGIEGPTANAMMDEYAHLMTTGDVSADGRLAKWLVESGQAPDALTAQGMLQEFTRPKVRRSSSLEYSRSLNLPFVDTDLRSSFEGWLGHTWDRLSWIEEFGQDIPKGASVLGDQMRPAKLADVPGAQAKQIYQVQETLDELLKELENNGGAELSAKAAQRLNEALDNVDRSTAGAAISQTVRTLSLMKLSYLATDNMWQGALGSMLRGGGRSTLAGLKRAFSDEAFRLATESGSRPLPGSRRDTVHPIFFGGDDFSMVGLQKTVDGFMRATGVRGTENLNRQVTSIAGWDHINGLYDKLATGRATGPSKILGLVKDDAAFAERELKKLSLPVNREPTDEELLRAVYMFDRDVNFEIDPWLRPTWSNNEYSRTVTQFMNWGYQQTRLIYNETFARMADGIINKDANELARGLRSTIILTTLYPAMGTISRMNRAFLRTLVGGAGAAVGEVLGSDPQVTDYIGDVTDDSPGMMWLRSANRMGGLPQPVGDVAETLLKYGRLPDAPTALGGDLTLGILKEILGEPLETWARKQSIGEAAAELEEGVLKTPGGVVSDFGIPATTALREGLSGTTETKPRK